MRRVLGNKAGSRRECHMGSCHSKYSGRRRRDTSADPPEARGAVSRCSDKGVQKNGREIQSPGQGACLACWRSGGHCGRSGVEG